MASFRLTTAQALGFFPLCGLHDCHRDFTAGDHGFEAAAGAAIFEARRCPLFGHCLSALDQRDLRLVRHDPRAHGDSVDALFRFDADRRDIDCINQPWSGAIDELDDREATVHSRIDAEDFHALRSCAVT